MIEIGIEYLLLGVGLIGAFLGWISNEAYRFFVNPVRDAYHTNCILPATQQLVKAIRRGHGVPAKDADKLLHALRGIHKDLMAWERAQWIGASLYREVFGLPKEAESLLMDIADNQYTGRMLTLTWPGLERPFTLPVK